MFSHENLDLLADAYLPLLALLAIITLLRAVFLQHWRSLGRLVSILVSSLAIAYGLMLLDGQLALWRAFDLDYSTHTAVAMALVGFLSLATQGYVKALVASLILYLGLVIYQGYHTPLDVLTTALAVGGIWSTTVYALYRGENLTA
ncbi:MAG: hypothetical protein ACFCBW_16485 [Candidatus Competibacterales bacterium]